MEEFNNIRVVDKPLHIRRIIGTISQRYQLQTFSLQDRNVMAHN